MTERVMSESQMYQAQELTAGKLGSLDPALLSAMQEVFTGCDRAAEELLVEFDAYWRMRDEVNAQIDPTEPTIDRSRRPRPTRIATVDERGISLGGKRPIPFTWLTDPDGERARFHATSLARHQEHAEQHEQHERERLAALLARYGPLTP